MTEFIGLWEDEKSGLFSMNLNNYNDTQFNAVNYAGGLRLLMANKHDSVLCLFHLYFFPFYVLYGNGKWDAAVL